MSEINKNYSQQNNTLKKRKALEQDKNNSIQEYESKYLNLKKVFKEDQ